MDERRRKNDDNSEVEKMYAELESERFEKTLSLEKEKHVIVANCTVVNVRKVPALTGQIAFIADAGTEFIVLQELDADWLQVAKTDDAGKKSFYLMKEFSKEI